MPLTRPIGIWPIIYEAVVSQKKQTGGNALKVIRSLPDRWATKEAELITEDLGARNELVPLAKLVSSDPEAFLNAWPKYIDAEAKSHSRYRRCLKGVAISRRFIQ